MPYMSYEESTSQFKLENVIRFRNQQPSRDPSISETDFEEEVRQLSMDKVREANYQQIQDRAHISAISGYMTDDHKSQKSPLRLQPRR